MLESTTLAAGAILLIGLLGGKLANYIKLPSVTGYLIAGLIVGPSLLNLIPDETLTNLEPINELALGIIAISIGGELTSSKLKLVKQQLPPIFFSETALTFITVTGVCYLISNDWPLSLVLGILSLATAPAAIISILKEYRARGDFPRLLKSLIALDNLFCIVGFGIITSLLRILFYQSIEPENGIIWAVFEELVIALALALFLGFVLLMLNRFSYNDDKLLVINLGMLLFAVGAAESLGLPSLLIAMIMGAIIANYSKNSKAVFRVLNRIEFPILVAFLTLAGIKLNLGIISEIGVLAIGYILARLAGKIGGARLGAMFSKDLPRKSRQNIGLALTPQAGVAIGLAILAENKLPIEDGLIITLILSTVIFFELVGPVLVKLALKNCDCIEE
ncbi:cation:proton antiporter [Natranaerobius thermophilus]|uniref:Sodium/hydrogen exchanger n=1 Tax=Natranaerobius thermophilus (strain ATCC BAA-1301 / DSM 18059 / JW/NM-WN-LF) TaxID=457570 RepID=B2A1H8_NATTJ|nr:cation:proton antiporter [Natranaerobius thermophilus]ACB84718.1 sodium/hydrogen exchanger [Natranaerobius thermophilus JW/NM-WN-LF]